MRPKSRYQLILILCLAAIVVLGATVAFLLWRQHNSQNDNKATSQRIIAKVDKLFILPTDEEPTVAEIQDKSKLSGQEFFKRVENGDYVLVYSKAKVAFLYRESINKLVNVGPINTDSKATSGN